MRGDTCWPPRPNSRALTLKPTLIEVINMLRLGNRIRLTRKEVELFTLITGFEPVDVKTLDDLDAYITRCKSYYWGTSRATRFLHWWMDRERSRCLGIA
jgi:hypothetical protein